MDEPCNGFDPISRKNFYYYLSTLKDKTIVLTTQRIDEAENICDKIAIMVNG